MLVFGVYGGIGDDDGDDAGYWWWWWCWFLAYMVVLVMRIVPCLCIFEKTTMLGYLSFKNNLFRFSSRFAGRRASTSTSCSGSSACFLEWWWWGGGGWSRRYLTIFEPLFATKSKKYWLDHRRPPMLQKRANSRKLSLSSMKEASPCLWANQATSCDHISWHFQHRCRSLH